MQPMKEDIKYSENDPGLAGAIESALRDSLRKSLPQAENTSFVLSVRDSKGILLGGLTASTSYGWLLVKTLWVHEAHRGRGLGRALMEQAEEKARATGCHEAWLDTSSPDAMRFYRRLGYAGFGELANSDGQEPAGHRRWFMKKPLSSVGCSWSPLALEKRRSGGETWPTGSSG